MDEICKYLMPETKCCTILTGVYCTGRRSKSVCKFKKTEAEYIMQADRAIMINRKKGNCYKCKYKERPCKLSTEGGIINDH